MSIELELKDVSKDEDTAMNRIVSHINGILQNELVKKVTLRTGDISHKLIARIARYYDSSDKIFVANKHSHIVFEKTDNTYDYRRIKGLLSQPDRFAKSLS